MTQANLELLDALETAGVPKEKALAAAASVAATTEVATKADLAHMEAARAAMETRLIRWMASLLLGLNTPVYAMLAYLAFRLPG